MNSEQTPTTTDTSYAAAGRREEGLMASTQYDSPVAPNVWGVETEHGPALRVPTSAEATASMRAALAAYKAERAKHKAGQ